MEAIPIFHSVSKHMYTQLGVVILLEPVASFSWISFSSHFKHLEITWHFWHLQQCTEKFVHLPRYYCS